MTDQAPAPVTERTFKAASEWLTSTPAAAQLPNETKLELYGLYKHITTGQPTGSRPSIFYPTPRAKYDAWTAQHAKYAALANGADGADAARGRYVAIAQTVGWAGEGIVDEEEAEEEIDFDAPDPGPERAEADEGEAGGSRSGASAKKAPGMGPRVSVMAQDGPESNQKQTGSAGASASAIHDAVVDDNLEEVRRLLRQEPSLVAARDDIDSTPLHLAADRGHAEIARLLVASGADKAAQDEDEQTPLQIAEMLGRTELLDLLR